MKKIIIPINSEHNDLLQRLLNEVDSKAFLIDRMFVIHMEDPDLSLFNSIPFQHYMKIYEKDFAAWNLARTNFKTTILDPYLQRYLGYIPKEYTWSIPSFYNNECEVYLND